MSNFPGNFIFSPKKIKDKQIMSEDKSKLSTVDTPIGTITFSLEPIEDTTMKPHKYCRLHIDEGTKENKTLWCHFDGEFSLILAAWNKDNVRYFWGPSL